MDDFSKDNQEEKNQLPFGFRRLPVDSRLQEEHKLTERYRVVVAVEAFNLFNRTQYSVPGVNIGSPKSFGLATSTPDVAHGEAVTGSGGPRALQLGLKLLF